VAEDEEAARDLSLDALREEIHNVSEQSVDVNVATYLPGGWSENCYVYGSEEDLSAVDALKLNPEYLEDREKLKKAFVIANNRSTDYPNPNLED